MAKLILTDNYNREYIKDVLVTANINEETAKEKANEYNDFHPHGDYFARVVPDDYKLWEGISELV